MISSPRILLAASERDTRMFLVDNLTADGYSVEVATSAGGALAVLDGHELVLSDVGTQTLGLVDALKTTDTPIIALLDGGDETGRVRLLERGADDVIVKPASYGEVRARVAAVLRRCDPLTARTRVIVGPLALDRIARSAWVQGREVHLSGTEFRLLSQLASEPTRTFTRQELMREVWGYRCEARSRTLDTHAHRLRRRLGAEGLVQNVWGIGYRLIGGGLHQTQERVVG